LQELAVPEGVEWELVVVNNGSSDETDEVLCRHAQRLPLRRLHEPEPGVSHARNTAVAAVRGELLLWTDDDVLVDRNWMAEYVAAARARPEISFFGGTIEPWLETPPPSWLTGAWPRLGDVYAVRDFGEHPVEVDLQSMPYGANYAMRTAVQRRYCYDTNLGRLKNSLRTGEETAVMRQMLSDGHRGLFLPTARVRHFIPRERLSLEFVRDWFMGLGQTHAIEAAQAAGLQKATARRIIRTWFWLNMMYCEAAYRVTRRWASPCRWVWYATEASYCHGWLS
jgi:glycosyltransferase involved in cell wall biosynthesis